MQLKMHYFVLVGGVSHTHFVCFRKDGVFPCLSCSEVVRGEIDGRTKIIGLTSTKHFLYEKPWMKSSGSLPLHHSKLVRKTDRWLHADVAGNNDLNEK